ncbi:hypothetical protein ABZ214_21430 [Streptomyces iakyrus]|uniref:hypothetical protein n=1 Tax=Streptomyces iakyrus TaxID=68219 RepID=UPI0033B58594
MDWTLEVLVVPVSDLDRAKAFYQDQCGFRAEIDAAFFEGVGRFVQLTPVLHVGASGWAEGRGEDDWNSFLFFQDPDGNGWAVQEVPAPLAQR